MGIADQFRELELLCEIVCNGADGKYTCKSEFITIAIVKGICEEDRLRRGEDHGIARPQRESMQVKAKQIPATKSSINALERLVFDSSESAIIDCTVCMEEIKAGNEAIKMPCSHVYHSNCIVKWLQISHSCPLCRCHVPCDQFG